MFGSINQVIRVTTTVEVIDGRDYDHKDMTSGKTYTVSGLSSEGGNRLFIANQAARLAAAQAEELARKVEADYGVCPQGSVAITMETRYPKDGR